MEHERRYFPRAMTLLRGVRRGLVLGYPRLSVHTSAGEDGGSRGQAQSVAGSVVVFTGHSWASPALVLAARFV